MSSGTAQTEIVVRFGPFETNLDTGETRKYGIRIRLGGQPTEILTALLENPGEVITREELRQRLWGNNTFVEFENGLNNAVKKLRGALGDSAEKPLYVETLPRVGYRFVAPIDRGNGTAPLKLQNAALIDLPLASSKERRWPKWRPWVLAAAACLLAFSAYAALSPVPAPRVKDFIQAPLTDHFDGFARIVTDGVRVYFLERHGDRADLMETSSAAGPPAKVETPFRNTRIFDVSRDGSEFLIGNFTVRTPPLPLWIWPIQGGSPVRVGDVIVDDASWTPDGQEIIYSRDHAIHTVHRDGAGDRVLVHTPGYTHWMHFSPDGRSLTFTVVSPQSQSQALWEVSADGSNPHEKFPGWSNPPAESCGNWTPDGRYFVFTSHHNGSPNLYAVRESRSFFHWRKPPIVQLTPMDRAIGAAELTRNGTRAFVNASNDRTETFRYDADSHQFTTIPEGSGVLSFRLSNDGGSAVLQKADWTLWRTHAKGGSPIQLTTPPLLAAQPAWSSDGSKIAFEANVYGKSSRVYVVNADGGTLRETLSQAGEQGVPAWSPDGSQLALAVNVEASEVPNAPRGIYIVNLSTGEPAKVPGSDGLTSPMWSPDGKYFTAKTADETSILLFDSKAEKWNPITKGVALSGLTWSRDSKYLYVQKFSEEDQPIYRLRMPDFKEERVTDCRSFLQAGAETCALVSGQGDGSLILRLKRNGGQIYALDLDFP
jgi:Tol biopolymer transport system component/DNA-binding winged helix-turn-helix (wHTH) protein